MRSQMCKPAWAAARINMRNIQVPLWLGGILYVVVTLQTVVYVILGLAGVNVSSQTMISAGNFLYITILLGAVIIPARNFRRIINLGGKRADFFVGALWAHATLAAIVSAANVLTFYAFDRPVQQTEFFYQGFFYGVANLIEVFGWCAYGPVGAFVQQFAFLFLLATFVHTLTALQDRWYGWLTDVAIIAVISVFSPIPVLRNALVWFFNLIIFGPAPLQILVCLCAGVGIYLINWPVFGRKAV